MKVLKDNYNTSNIDENIECTKPYPRKLVCEMCGSELEYDATDLRMGGFGCMHLDCPLCGYDNMIDDNENNITLTKDNIEYPTHFYHTSVKNGAIDVCNNAEVRKCIKHAIDFFRENKDEHYWYTMYGNLFVMVNRWVGDKVYDIIVCGDYYSMDIPFETKDYDNVPEYDVDFWG